MPCSDGGPSDFDIQKERLDETTALLCSVLRALRKTQPETYNRFIARSERLASWWIRHQKEDKRRKEREEEQKAVERTRIERDIRKMQQRLNRLGGPVTQVRFAKGDYVQLKIPEGMGYGVGEAVITGVHLTKGIYPNDRRYDANFTSSGLRKSFGLQRNVGLDRLSKSDE